MRVLFKMIAASVRDTAGLCSHNFPLPLRLCDRWGLSLYTPAKYAMSIQFHTYRAIRPAAIDFATRR
jgi:hypothetical protein